MTGPNISRKSRFESNPTKFCEPNAYRNNRKYEEICVAIKGMGPAEVVGEVRIFTSSVPLIAKQFKTNNKTDRREKLIVTGESNTKLNLIFFLAIFKIIRQKVCFVL